MDSEPEGHYYILDPSSLVYGGIGKIKQWVYTTLQNHKKGNKSIKLVFYVPSYTLRELDFLKKVFNPLISANARESIRFIDSQISETQFEVYPHNAENVELDKECLTSSGNESDYGNISDEESQSDAISSADLNGFTLSTNSGNSFHDGKKSANKTKRSESNDYTDFESYNKMKLLKQDLQSTEKIQVKPVTFILESEKNVGPDWKIASGYRRSTPLLSELPKPINGFSSRGQLVNDDSRKFAVGVFGNNIPGSFNVSGKNNNVNINSSNNLNEGNAGDNEKAVIPIKLKFLIRSCIQKQFIETKLLKEGEKISWDVICEDATTSIWLRNFGLHVKTINDVQTEFDKFSGESGAKVLFDPSSGKLVETNSTKFNRKEASAKYGTFKAQRNKGKGGKEGTESKNEIKSRKNHDSTQPVSKPKRKNKKNQNVPKNVAVSENCAATMPVFSADRYAERGQGELWTP